MSETTAPLEGIIVSGDDAALVSIQERSPLDIFTTPGVVPALLDRIREEALRDFAPDLSTDKGRKEIASRAFRVAKSKTYLDDLGKDEVARLKELPKQVDAARKALRDGMDALRDEIRGPLTAWEERRDKLKESLAHIDQIPAVMALSTSAAIHNQLDIVGQMATDAEAWDDLAHEAAITKSATLAALRDLLDQAEKREAEAAELERLRAEKVERDRRDREDQIRREAEEKARKDAEDRAAAEREAAQRREAEARLAQERAEHQLAEERRLAAEREERAGQEAAEAERLRAQREANAQAQQDALRAADIEHRRAFNREAMDDMADIIGGNRIQAEAVLRAIVTGQIRHISINY